MTATKDHAAAAALTREEHAKRYLEHTRVALPTAWALVVAFLLTIVAVPVVQHVVEIRANLRARRDEQAATGAPPAGRVLPQSWDVFSLSLSAAQNKRLPTAAELKEYETGLEEGSVVSEWLLPRAQRLLTGALGAGNEQAYPGRNGWLHYRSDVDYVTGPGFLDPARLEQRRRAGDASVDTIQPDPVRVLVRFHKQLAARGIVLIVVPTPVKPMIEPETLSAHYATLPNAVPLQNPSWPAFVRAMARENVRVFDPAPVLADAKRRTGRPQYLRTDTHWTPAALERVAGALADFITAQVPDIGARRRKGASAAAAYVRRAAWQPVENMGDVATMLKLSPANLKQLVGPPERVRIRPIRTRSGGRWRPRRTAPMLLLGDSFSNIYSQSGMGWGEGAGLAEQLSLVLNCPLDRIVINAGGSYTTRQRLRAELLGGKNRLAGKRVVVYQFAVRDLLAGDWKLLDLPPPPPALSTAARPARFSEEREP